MRSRETDRELPARRTPGALARLVAVFGRIVRWLLLSLLVSVLVEWAGMAWWWSEQGTEHSRQMLRSEIDYLDRNISNSIVSDDPGEFAQSVAATVHDTLFVKTKLVKAIDRLALSSTWSGRVYRAVGQYLISAMNIVQVFAARTAVLCLALPLFVLVAFLGLVDGLVQRDLRRWGGGRESSYLYHYAKRSNSGFLLAAWVIYLALPFSVPPVLIILPFAALFGLSVSITASMFKKYL